MQFLYATEELTDSHEVKASVQNRFGDVFAVPIITNIEPQFNIVGSINGNKKTVSDDTDFSNMLFSDDSNFFGSL